MCVCVCVNKRFKCSSVLKYCSFEDRHVCVHITNTHKHTDWYVCMYVCMYVCVFICMRISVYVLVRY
jgi:hypothetical protein